jgi:F0F1-type ATP synthase assembly protein I
MESAGAGLGVFISYMGQALPALLIVLALVGIIVAVGMGIAGVIKKSIGGVRTR